MRKDLIIVGNGREQNSRCPHKLIRELDSNTTIFDLYIRRLLKLKDISGYNVILALHHSDKELMRISQNYNIEVVPRNDDSVKPTQTIKELHHFMENYDNEYMMWVNASYPFIKAETLNKVIDYFNDNKGDGLHCVKRITNWIWEENSYKPMNMPDLKAVRTQDTSILYESLHFCHVFNRKFILKESSCWNYKRNDPILYILEDSIEMLDVDTEKDFLICNAMYNYFKGNNENKYI